MSSKLYMVQTWDSDGARTNHYEAWLSGPAEVRALKKFLQQKAALVSIVVLPAAKRAR